MVANQHALFTEPGPGGKHLLVNEPGPGGQHAFAADIVPPAPPIYDTFDNRSYSGAYTNTNDTEAPSDGGAAWVRGSVGGAAAAFAVHTGRAFRYSGTGMAYSLRPYDAGWTKSISALHSKYRNGTGTAALFAACSLAAGVLDGYALHFDGSATVTLHRYVAGVASAALATDSTSAAWTNGAGHLRLLVTGGNRVRAYVAGAEVIDYTDATPPTLGLYFGIGATTGDHGFDYINLPVPLTEEFRSASSGPVAGASFAALGATWTSFGAGGFNFGAGDHVTCDFSNGKVVVDTGMTSYTLQASLAGDGRGVIFRAVDTSNYWIWKYDYPGGTTNLIKVVAGVSTVVDSITGIISLPKVVVTPTTISLYMGETLKATATDSTHSAGTKVGIYGALPGGGTYGICEFFSVTSAVGNVAPTPSGYTNAAGAHGATASYVTQANSFRSFTVGAPLTIRRLEQEFYSVSTAMVVRVGIATGPPSNTGAIAWLTGSYSGVPCYADLAVPIGSTTQVDEFPDDIVLGVGTTYYYVAYIKSGGDGALDLAQMNNSVPTPNIAWAGTLSYGSGTSFISGSDNGADGGRPSLVMFAPVY